MNGMIFEADPNVTTVAQAVDWLRVQSKTKKGARCPCCKQYVKIYKRALGAPMARWLIWLVRTWMHKFELPMLKFSNNSAWVDIRLAPVRGGDYAKLVHWGLIEHKLDVVEKDNGAKDTKDSGYWRPTFAGIDFVKGALRVPSHVYLYDNLKLGQETREITIMEALGKKWSYEELMNAPINVEVPGL
jgi:hypothetical protein